MNIHEAAERGDIKIIEQALQNSEDINGRDEKHLTPLMVAAKSERASIDVLQFLIEHGAEDDVVGERSAFCLAVHHNQLKKAKYLFGFISKDIYEQVMDFVVLNIVCKNDDVELLATLMSWFKDAELVVGYGLPP